MRGGGRSSDEGFGETRGIEFVAADDDVFAGRAPGAAFDHRAPGPLSSHAFQDDGRPARRSGLVAAAAIVAIVALAVVAFAPWDDDRDDRAAGTTTTAARAALVPTGDRTDRFGPPGHILDPTSGFEPVVLDSRPPGEGAGWYEIWATSNRTRRTSGGYWFAVHVGATRAEPVGVQSARVTLASGTIAYQSRTTDLVESLDVHRAGRPPLRLTWVGDIDPMIHRLADSITVGGDGKPVYPDTSFQPAYTLITSGRSIGGGLDETFLSIGRTTGATYRSAAGDGSVELSVQQPSRAITDLGRFVVRLTGGGPSGVQAGLLHADNPVDGPLVVVRWTNDDGEIVTLTSADVSIDQLLSTALLVRRATAEQWAEESVRAEFVRSSRSTTAPGVPAMAIVGTGTVGPDRWILRTDAAAERVGVDIGTASIVVPQWPESDPDVLVVSTESATVVVARAHPGTAATLRVTTGSVTLTGTLVPVAESGPLAAAVAFAEPGTFEVALLSAGGAPVVERRLGVAVAPPA